MATLQSRVRRVAEQALYVTGLWLGRHEETFETVLKVTGIHFIINRLLPPRVH